MANIVLYDAFKHWVENHQSILIYSDTHFEDDDCYLMDRNWITPEEHVKRINKRVGKNDVLIHLGDVGNKEYIKRIRGYKILITGNHDKGASFYRDVFDEVYDGPVIISSKLILSHEPIDLDFMLNIHGHDHNRHSKNDSSHYNVCSNVREFEVTNLNKIVKEGYAANACGIHRKYIDNHIAGGAERFDAMERV